MDEIAKEIIRKYQAGCNEIFNGLLANGPGNDCVGDAEDWDQAFYEVVQDCRRAFYYVDKELEELVVATNGPR